MRSFALVLGLSALSLLAASSALAAWGDAPEITTSLGPSGGVIVLWPRVVPTPDEGHAAALHAVAQDVQQQLAAVAQQAMPGATVDARPEPERACPKETGCRAIAVSAVVTWKSNGCAVVATVAKPKLSPSTLVPMAGQVKLAADTAAFREPPEAQVTVLDFASCQPIDLSAGKDALTKAIAAAK